jgi:hypothetical protein
VVGDFIGNGEHSDLERIKTEQITLQLNDDKATIGFPSIIDLYKWIKVCP